MRDSIKAMFVGDYSCSRGMPGTEGCHFLDIEGCDPGIIS